MSYNVLAQRSRDAWRLLCTSLPPLAAGSSSGWWARLQQASACKTLTCGSQSGQHLPGSFLSLQPRREWGGARQRERVSVAGMAVLWHLPLPQQMEPRISDWAAAQAGRGSQRGFRGPGTITGRGRRAAGSEGRETRDPAMTPTVAPLSYWAFLTRCPKPRDGHTSQSVSQSLL